MKTISIPAFVLYLVCFAESTNAQLFGSRSVQRSMTRQNNSRVGQIQGNERFLRGQQRQNFVGADQQELSGFVGSQQGRTSGRIASPTGGMKRYSDRSGQINRPVPTLKKKEVYPPRMILPPSLLSSSRTREETLNLNAKLTGEFQDKINDSIGVSVAGRSATLRGVVASAKERNLAELLLHFEPGIDEIRNEISISNR